MIPKRVSVVIPTYNYAGHVAGAVDSVLQQTYHDYELIVVDDGSSDNTRDALAPYGSSISLIRQENGGVSSARNHGILESDGEFVAFLDADDRWVPEKLEKQVAFMDANPHFSMSYTDMSHVVNGRLVNSSYIHENGYRHFGSGHIFEQILQEGFIFTPTVIVRKECFNEVGFFDPFLTTCEDVDMWLRIADRFEVGFLDDPLAVRHDHDANCTKNTLAYLSNPIRVFSKVLALSDESARREIVRSKLKEMYFDFGYFSFSIGDMRACRRSMRKSLRLGKTPALHPCKYIGLSLLPTVVRQSAKTVKRFLMT